MSHWNYRVVHNLCENTHLFSIRECYYNDDNEIHTMSLEPSEPYGESAEELKSDLKLMLKAFNKPIVDFDTITYAKSPWKEPE